MQRPFGEILIQYVLLVAAAQVCIAGDDHRTESLVSLRDNAYAQASCLKTLQYAFTAKDESGWHAKAEFYGDHHRFRVNRQDIVGLKVGDKRIQPLSFQSAYDGKRHQFRDEQQSRLRLKDGSNGSSYSLGTPYTQMYGWLQRTDDFRWDTVLEKRNWEQRFKDARYVERVRQRDLSFDVIEFPPSDGPAVRHIYRVFFATEHALVPLKYERRGEKTDELFSTMEVVRFKAVRSDEWEHVVPLEVTFTDTGADGISRKMTMTMTIDENSIKLNEALKDELFTLKSEGMKSVYDVDDENRKLGLVEDSVTVKQRIEAAFDAAKPWNKRFAAAQDDARLTGQAIVVLLADPSDSSARQLFEDRDLRAALESQALLGLDSSEALPAEAARFLKETGQGDSGLGVTKIWVHASDGRRIAGIDGKAILDGASVRRSAVLAFLEKHVPAFPDAQVLLRDALQRAKTEGKRVLIQETSLFCPPCLALSRFLDRHRAAWSNDYIWVRIDARWSNAEETLKRYRDNTAYGVPWYAILDMDGKVLTSSVDGKGKNIGFPSSKADREHFRTMFEKSATRMTPKEIESLVEHLTVAVKK